jgi:hypothetical protein
MLDITNRTTANYVPPLEDLPPLLTSVVLWLLIFSGTVAVIIIIVSGIRLILSGGEAKTVETAKKGITYAILGLLLVFFSFLIINLIGTVTGVTCLTEIASEKVGFDICQTNKPHVAPVFNCATNESCEKSDAACTSILVNGSPDHAHTCDGVCCMHHR